MKKDIITKTTPFSHFRIFFDTKVEKFFEQTRTIGAGVSMAHELHKDHVLMKLSMENIIDSNFVKVNRQNINKFLPEVSFY
jgi:hypothetical protein